MTWAQVVHDVGIAAAVAFGAWAFFKYVLSNLG